MLDGRRSPTLKKDEATELDREAEFYAVVKGGQVGLSLRSMYQDLGIPMKIEIQSDSSTANSLTVRLGAGQRTKHIDTRYFWIQERVQDGDLSIKKVLQRRTAQMLERSLSLLQYYNLVFYEPWIPHSTTR